MDFAFKCPCPSCFQEIYLGECPIFSRKENKVLKNPRGPLARFTVEKLSGREYAQHDARRLCKKCGYHLPYNIEDVPSMILAVVGDTFSGKSHYIAALIHQLKTQWTDHISGATNIICMTPEVEYYYTQNYFEPFLNNRQSLPPNPANVPDPKIKPLIYKLMRSDSPRHPVISMNLMIYDTAGENFDQDRLTEYARFVLDANAFIFVADPFTMPSITAELPLTLQSQWQNLLIQAQKRRAVERLNHAIDLVRRYRGESDSSSLPDLPIAVMLSKSDLLEYVNLPPPASIDQSNPKRFNLPDPNQYTFMQSPTYNDHLHLGDINGVDQEVRAVLTYYKQTNLLAATARFHQVKFFATSATGTIPDANGIFPSVVPRRCLDPFLWIMYSLRVLGGRE